MQYEVRQGLLYIVKNDESTKVKGVKKGEIKGTDLKKSVSSKP